MQKTQTQAKPAAVSKPKAANKANAKPAAAIVAKVETKPAAAKPVQKPAAKAASKAGGLFYKAMLAEALAGKFGDLIQRFYVNAVSYHQKQKTVFPRKRIALAELLKPADARAFIEKHRATSIPAGSITGQRIFDEMMIETAKK